MKTILLLILLTFFTNAKAVSDQYSSSQETGNTEQNKVSISGKRKTQSMAPFVKQATAKRYSDPFSLKGTLQSVFPVKYETTDIPGEKGRKQNIWQKIKIGLSALAIIGTLLVFAYIAGIAGIFLIVPII